MTEQEKVKQARLKEKFLSMPMGEEKAKLAVKVFLQNPIFAQEYDQATDKVKEQKKWVFYISLLEEDKGDEVEWVEKQLQKVKLGFDAKDWETLIGLTSNNMAKGMYRKQAEEYLSKKR